MVFVFVVINYACNSSTNTKQQLKDEEIYEKSTGNVSARQDTTKNSRQQMIEDMLNAPMSGFADKDWADLMIIHHRTTQRLADFEFARGQHLTVARTAERIANKDNKEILTFKSFSLKFKPIDKLDSFKVEISQVIKSMSDTVPSIGSVDNRFIDLMIKHQETAIEISKVYLKYTHDAKIKVIAQNIILNSQKEIPKLKSIKPD